MAVAGSEYLAVRARSAARTRRRRRESATAWLYLAAPLALFGFVIAAPLVYCAWISLFHWDGVTPASWAGLSNYRASLSDPVVRSALVHSIVLVAFYSAIPICLGLLLTAIISRQRVRAVGVWRVLLFVPQVISVVVVGVAWQWLLDDHGPVNQLLRAVGLGGFTRVWLGDFTYALPTEGVIGTWMMSGLCMVLMLAAAQSIDPALYDAASVDGAGRVAEFFAVTLPGLRRVVMVCGVLTFAVSLNNFGLVWVTTQGGPGNRTQVLSTVVYTRAFVLGDLGMASALAIMLGALMMGTSFVLTRRMGES